MRIAFVVPRPPTTLHRSVSSVDSAFVSRGSRGRPSDAKGGGSIMPSSGWSRPTRWRRCNPWFSSHLPVIAFEARAVLPSVSQRLLCASLLLGAAFSLMTAERAVAAEPLRWHLELGGAHAVADPQDREYGHGTEGRLAAELALGRAFGLQLEGGSLWLAATN